MLHVDGSCGLNPQFSDQMLENGWRKTEISISSRFVAIIRGFAKIKLSETQL
ncbi:hypothetical protein CAter282_3385 [Collimonas arenae]|uniref:Uncharacterized protein n=1 Tax=Collimonas arenae TaxID=279058 RepID=A0A127QM61_9BURK|nr:hypothetical protein CAter10_3710 [Collimonas arenae]AMP11076.1 hypothetical protein CAter282_3385 [Collimonas arenae]